MDFKFLQGLGISVVVLGIILVIGSQITENSRDSVCGTWNGDQCSTGANNLTYTIANENLDALTDLSGYQGFFVLIGVMVVIIVALVSVTGYFKQ